MNPNFRALVLLAAFSSEGCTTNNSHGADIGPNVAQELSACGMSFSTPQLVGKICVSTVLSSGACVEQTTGKFVAIPIRAGCANLQLDRDFFPASIYGDDPEFADALSRVAKLVRKEARASSKQFLRLGNLAVSELKERQVSSLISMRLSPIEEFEYEFRFFLPKSRSLISLSISANGRKARWARVVE
jgi:hypothetical protein